MNKKLVWLFSFIVLFARMEILPGNFLQQSKDGGKALNEFQPDNKDASADKYAEVKKLIVRKYYNKAKKEVNVFRMSGKPPDVYRAPVARPSATSKILSNVPAYEWSFGCTATSAAMIAGYYDNQGYSNMYVGPTNGGVAPMNNSSWGHVTINGENRALCPIAATKNGLDGRTSRGHVDDFWKKYDNCDTDPFIMNGWTQHPYGDCTADYMKTNQYLFDNCDGSTTIYYMPDGTQFDDPEEGDGLYGFKLFMQSRGYNAPVSYNQIIMGYDGSAHGFTFENYKQEIDNGFPVIIQVLGHSMVGLGYDNSGQIVYLYDTWDYNMHQMTWGGAYSGLQQWGVSVIHPETLPSNRYAVSVQANPAGAGTVYGGGSFAAGQTDTAKAVANSGYSFLNWTENNTAVSTNPVYVFAVNGNRTLTANFIQNSGPGWTPKTNQQFNMTVIAQLKFNNVLSTNSGDVIGAFAGGECRGVASPSESGLLFLTVGSDAQSGETISFKAYNRQKNEITSLTETMPFQNQGEIGTLASPYVFCAGCLVSNTFGFSAGFTWFSININPGSMSLNSMFIPPAFSPSVNDRIIAQDAFSVWDGSTWQGTVTQIDPKKMYISNLRNAELLTLTGQAASAASNQIALPAGYTWMGYIPQNSIATVSALGNLSPLPAANDRIISQNEFSAWSSTGWMGSLITMNPGKGYKIKLSNQSVLVYPSGSSNAGEAVKNQDNGLPSDWKATGNQLYNMSVIAALRPGLREYNFTDIAAFVNGECRGVARVNDKGLFFLTISSNLEKGETVTLKAFDRKLNTAAAVGESIDFINMFELGRIDLPYYLTCDKILSVEQNGANSFSYSLGQNYPNPFNPSTSINYSVGRSSMVKICVYDMLGHLVKELVNEYKNAGSYELKFDGSGLASGIYYYRIIAGGYSETRKMMFLK
jgi:hypothetical protein